MRSKRVNESRWRIYLALVVLAGLIIRFAYLYFYSQSPYWEYLTVDNNYHHNWAENILAGNILGDTTYFRAPLYIFWLALVYKIFSISIWSARLSGPFIGMATIIITYLLGSRIFDRRVGLLAAGVMAIYPLAIYFENEILLDSLYLLLLLWSVYQSLRWIDNPNVTNAILTGVILGLAAITRPTALVIMPLIAFYFIWSAKHRTNRMMNLVVFTLGFSLIVGTTFIRNLAIADDPVLVSSQGGINFYIGNNETSDGISARLPEPLGYNWRLSDVRRIAEKESGRVLKGGEISSFWFMKALTWISEHPVDFLKLFLRKLYYSIHDSEFSNNRSIAQFTSSNQLLKLIPLSFGMLFLFGAIGSFTITKKNNGAGLLLSIILIHTIVIALFFVTSRFRLPLLPYYAILASSGIICLATEYRNSLSTALKLSLAGITAGLISFFPLEKSEASQGWPQKLSDGLYLFSHSDYQGALLAFQKAADVSGAMPEVNLNIGVTWMKLGQIDSAKFYLNREIEHNPLRFKSYTNMASLYLVSDLPDSAFYFAQRALSLKPSDLTSNKLLLRALSNKTNVDSDSLMTLAMAASARTSEDIYLLNEAGKIFAAKADYDRAQLLFNRALMATPPPIETDDEIFQRDYRNSPGRIRAARSETYYQLGFIAGVTGSFGMAIEHSQTSIELDSSRVEVWTNLINGYLSIGDIKAARLHYEKAILLFPANPYLRQINL